MGAETATVPGVRSVAAQPTVRWNAWLTAVLIAGLLPRLLVPFLSTDRLLGVVVDDAAYYLRLADNAARTGTPSMDGVHATNGFHPLWMAVLTPVARFVGDPTTQLRVAALLGVLCAAATFVVLGRLLTQRLGPTPAVIGLALWWLAPQALYSSVSGLEASLTSLLLAVLIWAAFRYRGNPDPRSAAVLGLCAAGVFLARSDAALAVIGVAAWLSLAVRQTGRSRSEVVRDAGVAGTAAVVACAPWWVWNLLRFGTVEQASAWSVPAVLWRREAAAGSDSSLQVGLDSSWRFLTGDGPSWLGVPLWLTVVLVGAAGWVLVKRTGRERSRDIVRLGLWLVGAGTVLALLHSGVRLYPRPYYFEWVRVAWAILAAGTISTLLCSPVWQSASSRLRVAPGRAATALAATAIAVAGCSLAVNAVDVPVYPWQTSTVAAARWVEIHSEPGDRVGSFNSGLLSLYSGRTVVNLDGVANNDAADAVARGQVAAYICDQDLDWFVDVSPQFRELYEPSLGDAAAEWHLEQVRTFRGPRDVRDRRNEITLFRSSCSE